jgi:hypothetical protein
MPVGSRWKREGLELSRDDDAETRFINEVLRGGGQGLLRAQDDQREESLDVDSAEGIRRGLNQETMNKCFYNDALKKQFLVSPAAIARELRRANVKSPQTQSDKDNFRVFRARGSRELEFSPSYLESHVVDDIVRLKQPIKFKLYRDKVQDHFLIGKRGEVKRVKVEVQYPGSNPVIDLEAWQVCPWFSAIPDEWDHSARPTDGEKEAIHSRFPNSITEFGDHVLKVDEVYGQQRLICTYFDLPNRRDRWLEELEALVKASSADSNKQIRRICRDFSRNHAQMWNELSSSNNITPEEIKRFSRAQKKIKRWFHSAQALQRKFNVEVEGPIKGGYRVAPEDGGLIRGLDQKDWPSFVLETKNEYEVGKTVSVQLKRKKGKTVFVEPSKPPVSRVPLEPSKPPVSRVPLEPSKPPVSRVPLEPSKPPVSPVPFRVQDPHPSKYPWPPPVAAYPRRGKPVPGAPKRGTPQSPRRKRIMLLLLLAGLVLVAVTRCGGGEPSVEYQDSSPGTNETTTEFSQVTMPVPITAGEWFAALNCVENPKERLLEPEKTVHVCYVAGDPDPYPISLFVYRESIGEDLAKRKRRACEKQATGEVFAYWNDSVFMFTVYREAALRSSISADFELLTC